MRAGAAGGIGGTGGTAQGAGLDFGASTLNLIGVPFVGNQAIAGAGAAGTAGGTGGTGGLAQGGGLYSGGAVILNGISPAVPTPELGRRPPMSTFLGNIAQGGARADPATVLGAGGTGGNGDGSAV